jgi:deltex
MQGGERNEQLYPPTRRDVFIPDCVEGRRLLRQLKVAFERKLIFTVGRSVTTGKDNRIVWNGIHHKTSINGGTHRFGWPDNTYFNRVTEELAAKGIF